MLLSRRQSAFGEMLALFMSFYPVMETLMGRKSKRIQTGRGYQNNKYFISFVANYIFTYILTIKYCFLSNHKIFLNL